MYPKSREYPAFTALLLVSTLSRDDAITFLSLLQEIETII